MMHNGPDLILIDKNLKQAALIDGAIPKILNNHNFRDKHNDMIAIYGD